MLPFAAEELGIGCDNSALQGVMTPNHARKLEMPGKFCDSESVDCYRYASFIYQICKGLLMHVPCTGWQHTMASWGQTMVKLSAFNGHPHSN